MVIGSFVYIPSVALTEIMGLAGFDFVVIDMEHGPIELETAEYMARVALATSLSSSQVDPGAQREQPAAGCSMPLARPSIIP